MTLNEAIAALKSATSMGSFFGFPMLMSFDIGLKNYL